MANEMTGDAAQQGVAPEETNNRPKRSDTSESKTARPQAQEPAAAPAANPAAPQTVDAPRPRRRSRSSRPQGQQGQQGQQEQQSSRPQDNAAGKSEPSRSQDNAAGKPEPSRQPERAARTPDSSRQQDRASRQPEKPSRQPERPSRRQEKPARRSEQMAPPLDRTFHPLERTPRPAEAEGRSGKGTKSSAESPAKNAAKSSEKSAALSSSKSAARTAAAKQSARRPAGGSRSPESHGIRRTWRDFVLQLAAVILGVAVTLVGSGLVSRWRQAREVRTVMQLVYEELKSDRAELASMCEALAADRQGMQRLAASEMDHTRLPIDTLRKYQSVLGRVCDFTPRTDALEVLLSSGTVSSVRDKELLLDMLECYSWMNRFADGVVRYNRQKIGSLNPLFAAGDRLSAGAMETGAGWQTMMRDPACAAFPGSMSGYFGESVYNGEALRRLDRVVESIGGKYGFE